MGFLKKSLKKLKKSIKKLPKKLVTGQPIVTGTLKGIVGKKWDKKIHAPAGLATNVLNIGQGKKKKKWIADIQKIDAIGGQTAATVFTGGALAPVVAGANKLAAGQKLDAGDALGLVASGAGFASGSDAGGVLYQNQGGFGNLFNSIGDIANADSFLKGFEGFANAAASGYDIYNQFKKPKKSQYPTPLLESPLQGLPAGPTDEQPAQAESGFKAYLPWIIGGGVGLVVLVLVLKR